MAEITPSKESLYFKPSSQSAEEDELHSPQAVPDSSAENAALEDTLQKAEN